MLNVIPRLVIVAALISQRMYYDVLANSREKCPYITGCDAKVSLMKQLLLNQHLAIYYVQFRTKLAIASFCDAECDAECDVKVSFI